MFDSIDWSYFDEMLEATGFSKKWRRWVKACLFSATTSLIVNGSPTKEFKLRRGLRQGDPLSPFLFIIAMEGLHMLMTKARNTQLIKGVEIGLNKVNFSHLFFADDALFLSEWSIEEGRNILRILRCFYLTSGLRLNLDKSNLFGVGVGTNDVSRAAGKIRCKAGKLPTIYLGVPLGARMHRADSWVPIIEKFQKRLNRWKVKPLSFGGRKVLTKAVLGSMASYYLSIFRAPKKVTDLLEKLRRDFFWGSDKDNKKMAWIKWTDVIREKVDGGLGIGSIYASNISLLAKWAWNFKNNSNSPWAKVIKSIYGSSGGFSSDQSSWSRCSPWGSVISAVKTMGSLQINFDELCLKQIGNGRSTAFWTDTWKGSCPFLNRFPRLFALEEEREASVADRIQNGNSWDWRRPVRDGREVEEFIQLRTIIGDCQLSDKPDSWVWTANANGFFTVSSLRKIIENSTLGVGEKETVWNSLIPSKVNILMWRIMLDRIPTRDNLRKREIDIDSVLCPVCGKDIETSRHLMFECDVAEEVWRFLERWWSFPFHIHKTMEDMVVGIRSTNLHGKVKKVLEAVFFTGCYSLWCFRNRLIFSRPPPPLERIPLGII